MTDEYSRVVYYDAEKESQIRLTVNEFRGVQYLHIRKYFLDFEGEWVPTKDGVSMPLNIGPTLALFLALSDLLSEAETDLLNESLRDIITFYKENNEPEELS